MVVIQLNGRREARPAGAGGRQAYFMSEVMIDDLPTPSSPTKHTLTSRATIARRFLLYGQTSSTTRRGRGPRPGPAAAKKPDSPKNRARLGPAPTLRRHRSPHTPLHQPTQQWRRDSRESHQRAEQSRGSRRARRRGPSCSPRIPRRAVRPAGPSSPAQPAQKLVHKTSS